MNRCLLDKADLNTPKLYEKEITSSKTVRIVADDSAFFGVRAEETEPVTAAHCSGDGFVLDFGQHCVGYLSFRFRQEKTYLDAPVRLRLRFGEIPYELSRDFDSYHGSLCKSWLQEEIINLDHPGVVTLPRRYAFRYLEVTVVATPKVVMLSDFCVRCITSADSRNLKPLPPGTDEVLVQIDSVAAKTLADCMQTAYEDGPKRDRRLWSGDLRLQALTDYYLYKNYALARRCLYLFAACQEEGHYLPGCLYQVPAVFFDEGNELTDYALIYTVSLWDYFEHTGDSATASDLFPIARRQIDLALSLLDSNGIITFREGWSRFIDWAQDLRSTISVQGVLLYALEKMIYLARALSEMGTAARWQIALDSARAAARARLFDPGAGIFRSACDDFQYSVHSQVWMILGGVIAGDEGVALLKNALADAESLKPVTPYMHHYVVEAMLKLGLREEALALMKAYWGGMVKKGADTFWELYDPADPTVSSGQDPLINSFCHAWSCSASYFIRKYFVDFGEDITHD